MQVTAILRHKDVAVLAEGLKPIHAGRPSDIDIIIQSKNKRKIKYTSEQT